MMTAALQALRDVPNTLGAWALDIANRLGKRIYDPRSLDRMERDARESSKAYNAARAARGEVPQPSRNRRPSI